MIELLLPTTVIRVAVAAVWLYEGLWCKLLDGETRQLEVVSAVPGYGKRFGGYFLKALGVVEVGIAVWVMMGVWPIPSAIAQTLLLVALNTSGIIFARHIIHDPGGMVVKNFSFLVLVWVLASLPGTH